MFQKQIIFLYLNAMKIEILQYTRVFQMMFLKLTSDPFSQWKVLPFESGGTSCTTPIATLEDNLSIEPYLLPEPDLRQHIRQISWAVLNETEAAEGSVRYIDKSIESFTIDLIVSIGLS